MIGFDPSTIALMIGGALGALFHALTTKDYPLWSQYALLDVVEGGALGILIPLIPLDKLLALTGIDFQLPVTIAGLTPLQKGAAMMFMSWPLISLLRERVLGRFQPLARTRRASDPPEPSEPPK